MLEELEFLSISNLNFAGYTGSKNQVRTRPKIKFVQLDLSKIKCKSTGVRKLISLSQASTEIVILQICGLL